MFKGFKEFATRGNVIDLAVAVVAGAAITALVGDFTTAIINPLIGLALGGGVDVGTIIVNGQVFDFTLLINSFITFIITLLVIYYALVVPVNKLRAPGSREGIRARAHARGHRATHGDSRPSQAFVVPA